MHYGCFLWVLYSSEARPSFREGGATQRAVSSTSQRRLHRQRQRRKDEQTSRRSIRPRGQRRGQNQRFDRFCNIESIPVSAIIPSVQYRAEKNEEGNLDEDIGNCPVTHSETIARYSLLPSIKFYCIVIAS